MPLNSRKKNFLFFFIFVSSFLFLLYKWESKPKGGPIVINGLTMGTYYRISYFTESLLLSTQEIKKVVEADLAEINRQMSTYIVSSEISRVNKEQANKEIALSPWFAHVLSYSLSLAKLSEGVFDPTVGPLVNLWGFGPGGLNEIPSEEQIKKSLAVVGYDKIVLKSNFLLKKKREIYLDLSSVAKGFAVDVLSKSLSKLGLKRHLVEIGGELKSRGMKSKDEPWTVGVEYPKQGHKILGLVKLKDYAIASSGNYRNFIETDKGRVFHTIDSRTGRPVVTDLASVTVVAEKCMEADALATTLVAMGSKRAKIFAEKNNVAAFFVITEGDNFVTQATSLFQQKVEDFSIV